MKISTFCFPLSAFCFFLLVGCAPIPAAPPPPSAEITSPVPAPAFRSALTSTLAEHGYRITADTESLVIAEADLDLLTDLVYINGLTAERPRQQVRFTLTPLPAGTRATATALFLHSATLVKHTAHQQHDAATLNRVQFILGAADARAQMQLRRAAAR